MFDDEIITKLAQEVVQSLGEVDEIPQSELLEIAKKTIKAERKKQILNNLNKAVITKLASYDRKKEIDECDSSVIKFLKEVDVINAPVGDIYLSYSDFCLTNGFQIPSKIVFSKEIQKYADVVSTVTTVNGRSVRIFKQR